MMTKQMAMAFCAALAGGCAMKEFSSTPLYSGSDVKFTGAVEDRVNLWPLAYYREPVGSVAWPFVSWGDDHLAFRPFYSQYRQGGRGEYDEFNLLWPIGQLDTRHDDYRVFPFFWGNMENGREPYFCLFPFLWRNRRFAGVFPLFWERNAAAGDCGFCVFPLYWHFRGGGEGYGSTTDTLFPLYYYDSHRGRLGSVDFWALCKLAGYRREGNGAASHWAFPIYLKNGDGFYSLPCSRYCDDETVKTRVLCGLAGIDSNTNSSSRASWLFPLYYRDKARLVTLIGGKSGDASWLFPLYYRDRESFYTLIYGRNPRLRWFFPAYFDSEVLKCITPLYGRNKRKGSEWLVPFYWRDKDSFHSILYGHDGGRAATNTYFAAGLAGIRSGSKEGGWLFPVFNKNRDSDFDEKRSWLDRDVLPDEIHVASHLVTNMHWNAETKKYESSQVETQYRTPFVDACDTRSYLLLADSCRTVSGHSGGYYGTNYVVSSSHKRGNRIVFNHESRRRVEFDTMTRKKTRDQEESETSLLAFVYCCERKADRIAGTGRTSHRAMWKLWDWEEENGDVSLDVFPGFTYDSKKNGYRKASFLWRLFRYESDPAKGVKLDLLFIPITR